MNPKQYMKRSLELALLGKGRVSPNPLVGAIIVKGNKIIGEGYHCKAGEDHAEIIALKNCRESPRRATIYVNLEPCCHYGKTPPCVDAIIKAGINKVVIAVRDPNPVVNGNGIKIMKENKIEIEEGILEKEAKELNKIFFKYIVSKTPYIILKAALTLDGKIATRSFDSKWVSCDESREMVHKLRADVDAVLVGKNTIMKDNPQLTSRLKERKSPLRLVLGSKQGIPSHFHIFNNDAETIFLGEKVNLKQKLQELGEQEITSILVEGGSEVFTQFITKKLVDEFYFFITPKILGDEQAISFIHNQNTERIKEALELTFTEVISIGTDIVVRGRYKHDLE